MNMQRRLWRRLDQEIYKEKYSLLISPYAREEIDYIVKTVSTVREQLEFDTFNTWLPARYLMKADTFSVMRSSSNGLSRCLWMKG
jgi:hypothetical protein